MQISIKIKVVVVFSKIAVKTVITLMKEFVAARFDYSLVDKVVV